MVTFQIYKLNSLFYEFLIIFIIISIDLLTNYKPDLNASSRFSAGNIILDVFFVLFFVVLVKILTMVG